MKKHILIAFILSKILLCNAQDNVWLVGVNTGDYSNPLFRFARHIFKPDTVIQSHFYPQSNFALREFNLCISKHDSIQFYSNGLTIFNAAHDTMLNTQGFNQYDNTNIAYYQPHGDESFNWVQAVLALPDLEDTTLYHLIHSNFENIFLPNGADVDFATRHVDHSIIDMKMDGGLGGLSSKNLPLITTDIAPCYLTACKHGSGKAWWILLPEYKSNGFYKLLLTSDGITQEGYQMIGSSRPGDVGGVAIFNPQGTQYALSHIDYGKIQLFDFDRCRGVLSDPIEWTVPLGVGIGEALYGLSFSPSGRFLYATTYHRVWQYDTHASDIKASEICVAVRDSSTCYGFLDGFGLTQLAPNGEIWIAPNAFCTDYHSIRHPDSLGIACNVQQRAIPTFVFNHHSLPLYPNYHLGVLPDNPCPIYAVATDEPQLSFVKTYPNPATDNITFEWGNLGGEEVRIQVYDAKVTLILTHLHTADAQQWQCNIKTWSKGIYACTISTATHTVTTKFIVE